MVEFVWKICEVLGFEGIKMGWCRERNYETKILRLMWDKGVVGGS